MQNKIGKPRKNTFKAFTIMEFVVIMVIFAIMASVSIFGYSEFQSSVSLRNLASEIGLLIRQAQSYGIVVTNANFDENTAPSDTDSVGIRIANDSVMTLFLGESYNAGGIIEKHIVPSTAKITDICVGGNSTTTCNHNERHVDIVFRRASTIPQISSPSASGVGYVAITIADTHSGLRPYLIQLFSSGAISVEHIALQ